MNFVLNPTRLFESFAPPSKSQSRKTDTGGPQSPESKLPTFGEYCIKAKTSIESERHDQLTFEGYFTDLSIADRVEEKCKQYQSQGRKCSPTQLCFLGPMRECQQIEMKDESGKVLEEWYLM